MKLLESAKDLKTSCYIYFFDTKKVRHNNQCTQLHNVGATYNINTILLRGCAILPIPKKLMNSHLVYSIFVYIKVESNYEVIYWC